MERLRIAVTAGEPAGIGPDLALTLASQRSDADIIVIADPQMLKQRAELLGLDIKISPTSEPGALCVQPVSLAANCVAGTLNAENAAYVIETLEQAVSGCLRGHFDAMVTAPVQKSIINDAGISFSGHTEFLQERTHTEQVVMMLATEKMRVALATTHLPLAAVSAAISEKLIIRVCQIVWSELRDKFGIDTPVIAVLGLNPHAGEGGHLGTEEIDTIEPALESLRAEGLQLIGPLPADTAFNPKILDDCDAVLAMYHDQGLPVLKYSGFGNAVNITLGLPIIRTSVDHGTALDLAGTGAADSSSLHHAIDVAVKLVRAQQR